jgi:hypothetical protein
VSLDFYRTPIDLSAAGKHARLLQGLPRDVGALAKMVQGLLIHEHMTEAYGVKLPQERHAEAHVRPLEAMLDRIVANDSRPLSTTRAPDERYVCVCRSFALFDYLAELTQDPDRHFDELRALSKDPRFAVPGTVFNAVLNRPEAA